METPSPDLHCAVDFGQITVGDHLRWLVADTNLESSRAPIHELNGSLCLERSDSGVDIVRNNVSTVE